MSHPARGVNVPVYRRQMPFTHADYHVDKSVVDGMILGMNSDTNIFHESTHGMPHGFLKGLLKEKNGDGFLFAKIPFTTRVHACGEES
jgi:hypothetical protein